MAEGFRIDVDVGQIQQRFARDLPNLTKEEIISGMRVLVGKLEQRILQNVEEMFGEEHSATRPPHLHLSDSILATVVSEGDLVVGSVGFDLAETPYARILEMGGVISPHRILPRNALAMKIPTSTLRSFKQSEETSSQEFILAFEVNHPGAHIIPYHFMIGALTEIAREAQNDLELAVVRGITRANLGSSLRKS